MAAIKYRIHEVGKDFGKSSKVVLELLAKYFDDTKNHMTALEDRELDIIFETFTQESAVSSFDEYFATASQPKPEEKKRSTRAKGGRKAIKFERADADLMKAAVKDAFDELAQRYYLEESVEPSFRASHDRITVSVPIVRKEQ